MNLHSKRVFCAANCSYGHAESNYDNTSLFLFGGKSKVLHSFYKMLKKLLIFSRKVFFLKMFPIKHWKQFWKPRRKRFGTSWIYFALYTNMFQKIYLFQKEFLLLKTLLWTRRIQFWQPQRYVFGRSPKSFQSISENVTNTFSVFFRKVFFFEMFLCKHRKQFWQLRRNCLGTNWIFLLDVQKGFEKFTRFKRRFFSSKNCDGHVISSFDSPNEMLSAEGKKFFTQFQKRL